MDALSYRMTPGGALHGTLRVPGDKSISHRAVILGALAEGRTRIEGLSEGEDVEATVRAFEAMGVRIERRGAGRLDIEGAGLHGLHPPPGPLDLGNSGTSMRLLAGVLAAQPFDSVLVGDASLSRRPMDRVAEPLAAMGAQIETASGGFAPLRIAGGHRLHGIRHRLPVPSAQVKSALLLAGLYAEGETAVTEPAPTRDHTERMLEGFGYVVHRDGRTVRLRGGGRLAGRDITIPGDFSAAAFFIVGAAIAPGSELRLQRVGVNPTRTGLLSILRRMGADIVLENRGCVGAEPVADIVVRPAPLRAVRITPAEVPAAIDEFPALFVAAACARGETVLSGARELRVKESDRLESMADGLRALGVRARGTEDGIVIRGGRLRGGTVDSRGDHRVAMAFAIAALAAETEVIVHDCANVATSFPDFVERARRAGLRIRRRRASA